MSNQKKNLKWLLRNAVTVSTTALMMCSDSAFAGAVGKISVGTPTLGDNSNVTGGIGALGKSLAEVIFNGTTTIAQPAYAVTYTLNGAADVTANAQLNSADSSINFAGAGKLTVGANKQILPIINFGNNAGTVTVNNNGQIAGVTGTNNGLLEFQGDANVTGDITNVKTVNINGAGS